MDENDDIDIDEILGDMGNTLAPGEQGVLVRFKDVSKVVRDQGAAAATAFAFAPATVTNKAYQETAKKLEDAFKGQGVDADVRVIASPFEAVGQKSSDLALGMGLGVGAVGLGYVGWRYAVGPLVRSLFGRRR